MYSVEQVEAMIESTGYPPMRIGEFIKVKTSTHTILIYQNKVQVRYEGILVVEFSKQWEIDLLCKAVLHRLDENNSFYFN
jgi:hypothetical protein